MKLIIERFEDGVAVLETEDEKYLRVKRNELPAGASEGDVLDFTGGVYREDKESTEKRREEMRSLTKMLFGE